MREIKFRAWWSGVKKMKFFVPGHFEDTPNGWAMTFVQSDEKGNIYLGTAEIMQYTGLKDKKGKEVYEGDLIKMYQHDDNTHKHEPARTWKNGKYIIDPPKQVKFMYGSFVIWSDLIKDYRCFANLARPGESFEVIGNIYENLDLITTP